jgi:hypothetical protein
MRVGAGGKRRRGETERVEGGRWKEIEVKYGDSDEETGKKGEREESIEGDFLE